MTKRLTDKQLDEITFLATVWDSFSPTEEEKDEYIQSTVHGKNIGGKFSQNRLMMAKTSFDRTMKMWREDLVSGLLSYHELTEDYGHDRYFIKALNTMVKGLRYDRHEIWEPGIAFGNAIATAKLND